jgi:hypothetical protein
LDPKALEVVEAIQGELQILLHKKMALVCFPLASTKAGFSQTTSNSTN